MTVINGNDNDNLLLGTRSGEEIKGFGGTDVIFGNSGDDKLFGGDGVDVLFGGKGNDLVEGNRGNDFMFGGAGNDVLEWDNGDGSDRMSGGTGYDVIDVDGSSHQGDIFTLERDGELAIFQRTNLVPFTLTVDSSEEFEVSGLGGDDQLTVGNLDNTGVQRVEFSGGDGSDRFDASNSKTRTTAFGDAGDDTLIGGHKNDILAGGQGIDALTGNGGRDQFLYKGNVFENRTPVRNEATGINVLNAADNITDFNIRQDQFLLNGKDLSLTNLQFQNSLSIELSGNVNVIVMRDGFGNAAAAAKAIADNDKVTSDAGVFVYFNTTLGISRLVFSSDLGDGGNISVLANLRNVTNIADQRNFQADNFRLA